MKSLAQQTVSHTPGPWVAIEGDTFNNSRPWGVSKYLSLAECQEIDGDDAQENTRTTVLAEVTDGPTSEADAKLMAAAPELLAACEAGRDAIAAAFPHADRIRDLLLPALDQVRAAIEKATGHA